MNKNLSIIQRVRMAGRVLVKGISGSIVTGAGGTRSRLFENWGHNEAVDASSRSAILAMCIAAWGLEYPQARYVVHNSAGEPQYDHPLAEMIESPNPEMDRLEYQARMIYYKLLCGTAYHHKLRNAAGNMIGLYPRHPIEISKQLDQSGKLQHYWHTDTQGKRTLVPLEDIVASPWMVRKFDDPSEGISPIRLCWTNHRTYDLIDNFVFQFLSNGGVPGTAIISKDGLEGSDDDKAQVKADFASNFGLASGGVGRVILLEGDMDVKRLAVGLDELALDDVRSTPEANICATFAVPAELVGVRIGLEMSTYSNKREARRGFTENRIFPLWEQNAAQFTRILKDEYGRAGWTVEVDASRVPALRDDEDKRLERAIKGFTSNLFYRDQALAVAGFGPEDNAKVYAIDLQRQNVPLPGSGGKAALAIGHKAAEDLDALWKSLDDARNVHVDALEKVIIKGVAKLRDEVLGSAKAHGLKREPKIPTNAELRKIFLDGTEEERIEMVKAMIERAVSDADFDFDEIESWLDGVMDEAVGASADKITQAYGTMRDGIVAIVKESADLSADEIIAKLEKYFDVLTESGARRIAQTTVTTSTSTAQQGSWKKINTRRDDGKVVENMWLTMRDGAVRDSHANRDGVTVPIGDLIDGSPGPGLSGIAEEDINCRCVLVPRTKKKG